MKKLILLYSNTLLYTRKTFDFRTDYEFITKASMRSIIKAGSHLLSMTSGNKSILILSSSSSFASAACISFKIKKIFLNILNLLKLTIIAHIQRDNKNAELYLQVQEP